MNYGPARVPSSSRPAPPTQPWHAAAGAAALAARVLLTLHTNRLITAAGLLAAVAAATAQAAARPRASQGRPAGVAPTLAAALILATSLLVLLGIVRYLKR